MPATAGSASAKTSDADLPPSSSTTGVWSARRPRWPRPAGVGAAGEADLGHAGMAAQRRPGGRATGDHVEDAGREPGIGHEGGEAEAGERRQFRRLQHDGVARRQRRRHFQGQGDERPVPGDDGGHDAVRFGNDVIEGGTGRHRGDEPVELVGPAGVIPEPLHGGADTGPGGFERLAHLQAGERGHVGRRPGQEVGEAQQGVAAGAGRGAAPAGEGGAGGGHGGVDLGGPGQHDVGGGPPGRGIDVRDRSWLDVRCHSPPMKSPGSGRSARANSALIGSVAVVVTVWRAPWWGSGDRGRPALGGRRRVR